MQAKIVAHERGEKLRVFKFKPKRGYKRTAGHRQELTRLEIVTVEGSSSPKPKRAAATKAAAPAASEELAAAPAAPQEASDGS